MDNSSNKSPKIERYCPLCNKRETRDQCSYGEKVWDKVSIKDEEYSMVRSELENIMRAANRLKNVVGKGEGNLEAWVQSKITKASDYIDTAADYLESGEHKFSESEEPSITEKIISETKKGLWANIHAKRKRGEKPARPGEKGYPKTLDIEEDLAQARKNVGASKCWKNKKIGNPPTKIKDGEEVPNCVPEEVNNNVDEAVRLQAQTGNILSVLLTWRGKTYTIRMFFPQVKLPTRKEVTDEIQKIYPGAVVLQHRVTSERSEEPLIQVTNTKSKNYLLNNKTIGEEVEIEESKKSEMPCNKPKAEAHGSGETGKSHVVKACENGKEKLIRFGQKGVKGSPKKKGESEEYKSRRERFKARHAKNISKGKMSAAYWADKVKW